MPRDDYELVDSDDFKQVKSDLDDLQKSPFINKSEGTKLKSSIDNLQDSLGQLLSVFKKASDEMTLEEKEERLVAAQIKPVFGKIDELFEQNKTIAEGMVSLADKVNDMKERLGAMEKTFSTLSMELKRTQQAPPIQRKPDFEQKNDIPPMSSFNKLPPMSSGPAPPNMNSFSSGSGASSSINAYQGLPSMQPPSGMPPPPPGMVPHTSAIPPLGPNELGIQKKKGLSGLFKK